jgi:hypothetical protein
MEECKNKTACIPELQIARNSTGDSASWRVQLASGRMVLAPGATPGRWPLHAGHLVSSALVAVLLPLGLGWGARH